MTPLVVTEKAVRIFNFFHDGKIHRGMACQNQLYRLAASFPISEYRKAQTLAWSLGRKGSQTVIVVMDESYDVWLDLRAAADYMDLEHPYQELGQEGDR